MSYQDATGYLYGLQKYGMKFGLDNIRRLMTAFDQPQRAFYSVHIAGTNGKGSTAAMLESILRTAGVKTGLFTSPHLVSFTERIRINGTEVTEKEIVSLAAEVREVAEGMEDFCPTFFEVVTTMAFLLFRKRQVDWAVVETGLGGRLDATNVLDPEVSVITMIDYDHREFLGNTLAEIAGEKAGIIKKGRPVVSADQPEEVLRVLRNRAAAEGSQLFVLEKDFFSETVIADPEAPVFNYRGTSTHDALKIPLAGLHQVVNASLAAKTAEVIQESHTGLRLDIPKGIRGVRWPGRLEMVSTHPPVLIDGAHNPHAAGVLALHLRQLLKSKFKRIIAVFGVMGDKDVRGILEPLMAVAAEIVMTAPAYGRAAPPEALAALAVSLGHTVRTAPTVAGAIELARHLWSNGDLIVITGSFYTIGEAKEALGQPGILTRLRE
ncbi:MAG: bifunctional folylpolyglutamate synthase/dihydrofolate synthase [Thermodesulfovibrio sp.]|nr:bifunctional folylpolyglutamate synthase/dihydrofolate synthase [Thermodesulfovibrio sp.]